MHVERTHGAQTGDEVFLLHTDHKTYNLSTERGLSALNEILEDSMARRKKHAMELAIKLEQHAHAETKQILDHAISERNDLERQLQIAQSTISVLRYRNTTPVIVGIPAD